MKVVPNNTRIYVSKDRSKSIQISGANSGKIRVNSGVS